MTDFEVDLDEWVTSSVLPCDSQEFCDNPAKWMLYLAPHCAHRWRACDLHRLKFDASEKADRTFRCQVHDARGKLQWRRL